MTPGPGEPEIRPHRPRSVVRRRRTPLLIVAAAALAVGVASPAFAQQPAPADAPGATTTTTALAAPADLTPEVAKAAPGTYSAPRWLPLRFNRPGNEVKVGCTLNSHGSQHGYECSGHHSRWAIDFIADTGTPVYAAGAGFATNLTGKPGGSGFGNVVSIDHGFGITTLYAHLSEAYVPADGTWVDENTLLGKVGQTGSASTPHLHFEEFGNPGGSNSTDPQSIDPGPLFGCRGKYLVSFPQVAGFDSWAGLPWGSLTVASDGDACADPAKMAVLAQAASADEAKDEADADADAASSVEEGTTEATTTAQGLEDPWWSDVLIPLLDMVASTGQRLHLPN